MSVMSAKLIMFYYLTQYALHIVATTRVYYFGCFLGILPIAHYATTFDYKMNTRVNMHN